MDEGGIIKLFSRHCPNTKLNKWLKRIPKEIILKMFALYDGHCRWMTDMESSKMFENDQKLYAVDDLYFEVAIVI